MGLPDRAGQAVLFLLMCVQFCVQTLVTPEGFLESQNLLV